MYNEGEYIYQEFQKNFKDKRKNPIVLYGIGNNTGKLLPRIKEYNIVGLMDGKKKTGNIWEKDILDYKDVQQLEIKTIIIIARPAVISVIYHRIEKFCKKNGITVYDIKGRDLSKVYVNHKNDIPYFQLSMENLRNEIEKHDIISFDIFDTLVMRKTLYPRDIFYIIERKLKNNKISFAELRIAAEDELYKKGINPTIDEIYESIQKRSGISDKQRDELLKLEIDTELEFLVPRNEMLILFNSIKKIKTVYLITDMYLTKEFIVKILRKCGYQDYEDIYISCEKKKSKEEGLFDIFCKEILKDKETNRCLHIGDNYYADVISANKSGLDVFQIMSSWELLANSSYNELLTLDLDLLDRLAIGLFCEKAFNHPFALYHTKGKLNVTSSQSFAYLFISPMIFYFTIWLIQRILQLKCDYVLYPSRDSFLIKNLCNIVKKNQYIEDFPEGEYFYTSRRGMLAATIWNEEDIIKVIQIDFWGDIRELFKRRFDIEIEEQGKDVRLMNNLELNTYVKKYKNEIIAQCENERKNYIHYLLKTGISSHEKIAFLDFVAAGKIQNGLEKLIPDKNIQGFYFLKREANGKEIDRDIHVESFYPSKGAFQIDSNVYLYYLFLELVLTSPEATFHSFRNDGTVQFMKEDRSKMHIKNVLELQSVVAEYAEEFTKLYPNLLNVTINRDIPDKLLGFLGREYSVLDIKEITSLNLVDEFLSQTFNILN